jgi:hypothetical protein
MSVKEYLDWLRAELESRYTPPHVPAGNDRLHCDRMARWWGSRIYVFLKFDRDDYVAACWLHNLDVTITGKLPFPEAETEAGRLLELSPFEAEARKRIMDVLRQHPFKDDPGDPTLLTAVRIADRVDKLDDSTLGIVAACAMRGVQVLAYDPVRPFNYTSTEEGKLKSIYNDFMRQLEWYGMLPSDEARALVSGDSMRFYVTFVRRYAAFISRVTGKVNESENDLRRALGQYYAKFA